MHIFGWNSKSVDHFRCSLLWHSKNQNIHNKKKEQSWGGGLRKMLIFFANSNCENFFIRSHHLDPISYLYKFDMDPMLQSWDPTYPKILVAPLILICLPLILPLMWFSDRIKMIRNCLCTKIELFGSVENVHSKK